MQSPMLNILNRDSWDAFQKTKEELISWAFYPMLQKTLTDLKRDVLFHSPVHGESHIERVIVHGAMIAMDNALNYEDTALLLCACCYHDTGRVSDWLDENHGLKSAYKLAAITGLCGDSLAMLMGAMEAHSKNERLMDDILRSYNPKNFDRAKMLARMLKDADGLDRVRLSDLDTRHLRFPTSVERAEFSRWLFEVYTEEQVKLGIPTAKKPDYYNKDLVVRARDMIHNELEMGIPAAGITSGCLNMLLGNQSSEFVLSKKCDAEHASSVCGAYEGVLAFVRDYAEQKGLESDALIKDFRSVFSCQYRSVICSDLRPEGFRKNDPAHICAPYMLDIILFTYDYLLKRENN